MDGSARSGEYRDQSKNFKDLQGPDRLDNGDTKRRGAEARADDERLKDLEKSRGVKKALGLALYKRAPTCSE
jgi:hypothetical protein